MNVVFYGRITQHTNGDKEYTPKTHPSSLRALVDELSDFYGEQFESFIYSNEACIFLINGRGIILSGGLDSPIGSGDKIEILPFVEAG
jgi:molybdopterin converting factor small subunit